jgi:predicted GTPase
MIIEDGPTLTHERCNGAGTIAAQRFGMLKLLIQTLYCKINTDVYKNILKSVCFAIGYGDEQMNDLEKTINRTECDSVVIGTPIDLGRLLKINKPSTRVKYELKEIGKVTLGSVLKDKGIL